MTKKMNNKQLEKIEKLKSFLVDSGQVSKFSLDFGERKVNMDVLVIFILVSPLLILKNLIVQSKLLCEWKQ